MRKFNLPVEVAIDLQNLLEGIKAVDSSRLKAFNPLIGELEAMMDIMHVWSKTLKLSDKTSTATELHIFSELSGLMDATLRSIALYEVAYLRACHMLKGALEVRKDNGGYVLCVLTEDNESDQEIMKAFITLSSARDIFVDQMDKAFSDNETVKNFGKELDDGNSKSIGKSLSNMLSKFGITIQGETEGQE